MRCSGLGPCTVRLRRPWIPAAYRSAGADCRSNRRRPDPYRFRYWLTEVADSRRDEKIVEGCEVYAKAKERAKDGAKAFMEYQANSRAMREKTARLRALRLAKEAAEKEHQSAGKLARGVMPGRSARPGARERRAHPPTAAFARAAA